VPIDDPLDALEKQLQMEDLPASPVERKILAVGRQLPLVWPLDKIVERLSGHLAADSLERMRLVLETCIAELRKHEDEVRKLRGGMADRELQRRVEAFGGLLLDAARKAENTRAKERVRRIAIILANATIESKPVDGDEVEEMMRVAMELNDHDVDFLRELIRIQGSLLATMGHVPRFQAHQSWVQGPWGDRIDPEIDSVFSKLESYGLVARIAPPNNLNISADFQNRYVLLKKGARFVALVQEAAANQD
jgi:hypothetical protein